MPLPRAWPSWPRILAGLLVVLVVGIGATALLWPRTTPTPEPSNTAVVTATFRPTPTATPEPPTPTETPEPLAPTDTLTPTPTPTYTPTNTPVPPEPTPSPTSTPSTCAVGDTWTRPSDGMVMVCVPAGEFLMGSKNDDPEAGDDEKPPHTVYLDAFWIDRTEVTNAQYRRCLDDGACEEPRCWDEDGYNSPDQPVVCVSWDDALAYAAWAGGRLPTEAEWEKAARGTDGRKYPWGNSEPDCSKANYGECMDRANAVGSYPAGASPYGALGMAGNVWEWVADWYDGEYYSDSKANNNPPGPVQGDFRVLRGGSFLDLQGLVRCAARGWGYPFRWNSYIGFRVVVAPGPSGP